MNARAALLAGLLVAALAIMPALAVAPSADFNGTPTSGCSPLTVNFVDMSTGVANNTNWSYGDGSTYEALGNRNVSHTYTVGAGTATFTVSHGVNGTLGVGSDIETKSAYISVTAASYCHTPIDPNVIDFSNLSTLVGNVARIFPGIIVLIVSIVPLYIAQGLIYLLIGFFGALTVTFAHMWRG